MTRVGEDKWTMGGGALPIGGAVTFTAKDKFSVETNDGNIYEHKRVTPVTLNASQLNEFTGAYSSSETGATYRLAVEKGQLILKIDRAPEATLKLTPSYKDAFLGGGVLVRFYRNSAGKITELGIGDNRMRDLRAPRMK
jgi:hypothetical protein